MKKALSVILTLFMLTAFSFTALSVFAQSTDTEITSIETLPKKQWGWVEDTTASAPEAIETATNIDGVKLTPVWTGVDGFSFGSTLVGNELVAYTATYTAPDGFVFAASLAEATENTTLSDDGKTLTYKFYTYVIPKNAIYIDDGGSNSTDDYAEGNVQKPYKTIDYAMQLLESKGGGVIVVVDRVTENASGAPGASLKRTGNYTIMGWDEESVLNTTKHYNLRANTTIRDITLEMTLQYGGIYTNGYALTLGDKNYTDLVVPDMVKSARQILMSSDGGSFTNPGKLTINSGDYSLVIGSGHGLTTVKGDVEIEVNGGNIQAMYLGLHCGSDKGVHTVDGNIKATVNGGSISTLNMGSNGARYLHNGNCDLTVNGGTIYKTYFRSTNANVEFDGKTYPVQNGDYTLTINGGTFTGSITDTTADGCGVTGKTVVDILGYSGDRAALLKKISVSQFDEVRSQVVYVDAAEGADTNDGLSEGKALATVTAAFKKFADGVAGKIIILSDYDTALGMTDTSGRGHLTISTASNAKVLMSNSITMKGDTLYESFNIGVKKKYLTLFAGGYKLVMGENVNVTDEGGGYLQLGNATVLSDKSDIEIYSGTYGLIYSGGDFNGGSITNDALLTIHGGTFNGEIYAGGYVASDSKSASDNLSGKIGGKIGLYIEGGTFNNTIYLGGNQYGTVGSVEAKISGGTVKGTIKVGPNKASGTYTPESGDPVNYKTNILGNATVEISGGVFTGRIEHTGNGIDGKAVILATNGTSISVKNPEKFDYTVTSSAKGTTSYNPDTDKFTLQPLHSTMDIFVNGTPITKSEDNTYTLSGADNNLYNVIYGGNTSVSAKFIITPPMAELTPVSEVILTGGKNTYNEIGNCTASRITWEPADSKFDFDTVYTASLTLSAASGLEFSDDLSGIVVNGGNKANTVTATLSEDCTEILVKVTFPKTSKSDFTLLSEKTTSVRILFETLREGNDEAYFNPATVTLVNRATDKSDTYTATENGKLGEYSATIPSGIYDITVRKHGYIDAVREAVRIDAENGLTIDLGALIPGDVIGENEDTNVDGNVTIEDFLIVLKAFSPEVNLEVKEAANINETGVINVSQLGAVKGGFGRTADECQSYDGLFENTYYKLTVDKKLTVGYIGGSIIQGAGVESAGNEKYIDRMHKWFSEQFPEAEIHSINAGISNTGSNFANFRLESDLMLRDEGYIPDLVFLEFCVNDFNTFGQDHIEMLYESLIRNVYEINPNADIVCLLTALSGYNTPKEAHIKVANHYGIPVIDLGTPMSTHYILGGDCKIFTNDELHPNGMGYELYAKLTRNLLEKYIVYGTPSEPEYTVKELPEQLSEQLLLNARAIPMTDDSIIKSGSWTSGRFGTGSRIFASDKNADYILSSTKDDTFTFTFEGDAFGFMVRKSAAMGTFEYKVDDGDWKECNFGTSQLYTHCQIFMPGTVSADEALAPGKHTVTVRVTGKASHSTSTGCEVGIAGILYNGLDTNE